MNTKIEAEKLFCIRINQKELKYHSYIHLRNLINIEGEFDQLHIFPSTYMSKPCSMQEKNSRCHEIFALIVNLTYRVHLDAILNGKKIRMSYFLDKYASIFTDIPSQSFA